jgi:hypothetical protein
MRNLRERVQQLKAKRPGYAEMLDFYVKVREAQAKSKTSLKMGPLKPQKEWKGLPSEEGVPLVQKEDFPVDMEASIRLFHTPVDRKNGESAYGGTGGKDQKGPP